MSSAPFFAERNSSVQQLHPSPEAVEPLQHVLHAGLKILLDLEESKQRARPVQRTAKTIRSVISFTESKFQPAELTSAAGSCGSAALWLPLKGLRPHQQTPAERTQSAERQKQEGNVSSAFHFHPRKKKTPQK